MKRPSKALHLQAFTLIELLIVVAIIAILAAIAVPNFLEAQTRSKVSRAKADMRRIATGLEAYYVDNNHYPPSYDPNGTTINPRIRRLIPITTPIAYMTSVPLDPFNREEASNSPSTTNTSLIRTFIYADRETYGKYVSAPFGFSSNGDNLYRHLWGRQYPSSHWLLRSRGPMGTGDSSVGANLGDSVDKLDAYDPTNGTVSNGNIFMLGPGVGFLDG
jgi:type II secretion system protein G